MWTCAFRSLSPRIPWSLLLALLLLPMSPAVVQAASATEATTPDCAQSGLEPLPVAVQLDRRAELVHATLHAPPGNLPASGCLVPLEFHIPEDARPPYAIWRDVEARAVLADGTLDPAHPDPLSLRLWIQPDGNLEYEVREAGVKATHATLDMAVVWGTTAAANDLAVLDILGAALGLDLDIFSTPLVLERFDRNPDLGLELDLWELGAGLDDNNRVQYLGWEGVVSIMHVPAIRVGWDLPSELGQLTALSWLKLGGPLLRGTIPPELGRLKNLQQLTLAGSRLTGPVPPELGQLSQLSTLDLHDNRLTALPPELVQLPRLWRLNLDDNQLTSLPPELGTMTHLSKLRLARNQLTSLPPELGTMASLTELGLAGNQLTSLPPELGQLSQLEYLDLAGNQLETLPPELGHLPQLAFLDVQDNQLTALPSLAGLSQLDYLDLSGNRLTRLPPGLEQIPALSRLDMSDNRLQELNLESLIPPPTPPFRAGSFLHKLQQIAKEYGVGSTHPLRILDLSGNQLTSLPPEIGRFRLEHLDLSGNRLTTLPPELGQIRPLIHYGIFAPPATLTLDLSDNRLTEFPPELGRISHLYDLDLSDNQITDLRDVLLQTDRLYTLNLSGNQLETLPPEIGEWSKLIHLDLSGNQLTALPSELGQLEHLTHLDLSDNRLATLPPELGQLEYLVHLDLSGNQLTVLPPAVAKGLLDLSDNPLIALPAHPKTARGEPLELKLRRMHLSDLHADLERVAQWPNRVIHLDLSDNQLTEVPSSLTLLRHVRDLNLSHNQITDLFLPLGKLELHHLNLSHNQLTDLPPDLAQLEYLTVLDLSHNQLTDLPPDLDKLKILHHLNLSHNQFTEIPAALSQLPPLRFLDLRGNPLTSCALPLLWRIERSIYPPAHQYNFDQSLMSLTTSTEHPDLPFLDLCVE